MNKMGSVFPDWLSRDLPRRFLVQKFLVPMTCFILPIFSTPDLQTALRTILTPVSTHPRARSGNKHRDTRIQNQTKFFYA